MSKISKEGFEQIQVIKNALDSMFDKLDRTLYVPIGKKSKNVDGDYKNKGFRFGKRLKVATGKTKKWIAKKQNYQGHDDSYYQWL